MCITRLGDVPSSRMLSTGVFAGSGEPGEFSQLGYDRHCRNVRDSSERLQSLDHRAHLRLRYAWRRECGAAVQSRSDRDDAADQAENASENSSSSEHKIQR